MWIIHCKQALMENISREETHWVDFESPAEPRYLQRRAVDRVGPLPQGAANTQKHNHVKLWGHDYSTLGCSAGEFLSEETK